MKNPTRSPSTQFQNKLMGRGGLVSWPPNSISLFWGLKLCLYKSLSLTHTHTHTHISESSESLHLTFNRTRSSILLAGHSTLQTATWTYCQQSNQSKGEYNKHVSVIFIQIFLHNVIKITFHSQ